MPNGSHSAPVREDFADELRGFALLGIVVVNAPFLGISWHGFTQQSLATPLDVAAAFVTIAFAQAKFYVLFSFLFGYSMSFIVKNESPAGIARFRRRLIGLAAFGVLHAVLFFVGDILLLYALLGGCLLWLRQKSDAFVLRFVWTTLAAWCALLALVVVAVWHDPADFRIDAAETRIIDSALRSGTLWEATAARLRAWPSAFSLILTLNGLCVLSMFALGLFAGRRRMFAEPQLHIKFWRNGAIWGSAVGLPAAVCSAWMVVGQGARIDSPGLREVSGVVVGFLTAPFLTWAYVAWCALIRQRRPDALAWFRRSGRMSLTGYIGESALLSLIFCGYGLGLFLQLGAARVMLIALAVWLVLDLFAMAWLRVFDQGPLERLLRLWVR